MAWSPRGLDLDGVGVAWSPRGVGIAVALPDGVGVVRSLDSSSWERWRVGSWSVLKKESAKERKCYLIHLFFIYK